MIFPLRLTRRFAPIIAAKECRREIFNSSLAGKEVDLSETDDETEAPMMQM